MLFIYVMSFQFPFPRDSPCDKDAAGRDWNMKSYTEMVARTTTSEVMIEGTSNRLLECGHDLAEIIGGVGKNSCHACRD